MIDPEHTGFITFAKLKEVMEEKLKETDTIEDFMDNMKLLDKEQMGKIPAPLFKQIMMNQGKKMTLEEYEEMLKEADPKGEGAIDIEEFASRICPPKK